MHGLMLTYKLDVKEAGKHTMRLPLLNGCAAGLSRAGQQLWYVANILSNYVGTRHVNGKCAWPGQRVYGKC